MYTPYATSAWLRHVHTMRFLSYDPLYYYAEIKEMNYKSVNLKGIMYNQSHGVNGPFRAVPDYGNHQKGWTLFKSYLLEFE